MSAYGFEENYAKAWPEGAGLRKIEFCWYFIVLEKFHIKFNKLKSRFLFKGGEQKCFSYQRSTDQNPGNLFFVK